jgi:hypothetical protein
MLPLTFLVIDDTLRVMAASCSQCGCKKEQDAFYIAELINRGAG